MYEYIKGEIQGINTNTKNPHIIIENNFIGYNILVNERTINKINKTIKIQKIYTTLIHKEELMYLCGFLTKEERDIFNILQSVSGVGVKVAFTLLNEFDFGELISLVIKENAKEISRTKGIGEKLAQKIIIELKDKLLNWQKTTDFISNNLEFSGEIDNQIINDVKNVLSSFGYAPEEIKKAIEYSSTIDDKISSENILKFSLEFLSKL